LPAPLRVPSPSSAPRRWDRISHSPPAPDPRPHAAPWQTSAWPGLDALPQFRSAPEKSRPASWSARPATTGYYAASGKNSAPDTRSGSPTTLPPNAPSRAALHREPVDPPPDPPISLPAALAT